jgi:hypothetical protein
MVDFSNQIMPAIFTIIGVIIGGLFSNIIPHFLQVRSAYKIFRRSKLEDLYNDLCNWSNTTFYIFILNFYLVFRKEIDWNGYLDRISESNVSDKIQFFKSEIIVNLYFKEFITDLNNLTESMHDISRFINSDIKKTYLSGSDILIHKTVFDDKVNKVTTLAEVLKNKIKDLSQQI